MKKKMSREERAEFKNGKYMGGPAEEKAEMKKKTKRMAVGGLPANAPATPATPMSAAQKAALPPGLSRMAQLPAGLRNRAGGLPPGIARRMPAPATPAAPAAPATMARGGMVKPNMAAKPDKAPEAAKPSMAAAGGGRGTGLPPGLAKRGPGNLPPGLAKKMGNLPPGLSGNKMKKPDDDAPKAPKIPTNPATTANPMAKIGSRLPSAWRDTINAKFGTTFKKGGMVRGQGCAVRGLKTSKKMG